MELKFGQMEQDMKANIEMEKNMDKEPFFGLMDLNSKYKKQIKFIKNFVLFFII